VPIAGLVLATVFGAPRSVSAAPGPSRPPGSVRIAIADDGIELGTSYDVVVIVTDSASRSRAEADLAEARLLVRGLERQFSEWIEESEVSVVNREAGAREVPVSPDLWRLLVGSMQVTQLTQGAFDITWKPLGRVWEEAARTGAPPDSSTLAEVRSHVGSHLLELTGSTVRFRDPHVAIGVAGVAKGWIVDAVFHFLWSRGYHDLNVNIGGDLRAAGRDETGSSWTFLIADPFGPSRAAAVLAVDDFSMATSGDVLRGYEIGGVHHGHILDPHTGFPPAWSGSVTVLARDCAMADALATGCFVLGPERALALADSLDGVDIVVVTRDTVLSSVRALGSRRGDAPVVKRRP
jgi:thiamine biosynthesis lipoprotein